MAGSRPARPASTRTTGSPSSWPACWSGGRSPATWSCRWSCAAWPGASAGAARGSCSSWSGLRRLRRSLPGRAFRRHAAAGRDRARARRTPAATADGRAVRRAGRDDPRTPAGRADPHLRMSPARRVVFVTHSIPEAVLPVRPRGGDVRAARPDHGRRRVPLGERTDQTREAPEFFAKDHRGARALRGRPRSSRSRRRWSVTTSGPPASPRSTRWRGRRGGAGLAAGILPPLLVGAPASSLVALRHGERLEPFILPKPRRSPSSWLNRDEIGRSPPQRAGERVRRPGRGRDPRGSWSRSSRAASACSD